MKKASEYRQHADECRALASQMQSGEQREQLMKMAAQWERMAADRATLIQRTPSWPATASTRKNAKRGKLSTSSIR